MSELPRSLDAAALGAPFLRLLWDLPAGGKARCALLLAHGAGAPLDSEFLEGLARRLAGAGVLVLRFDYPYMARRAADGRRRPPDRTPRLLAAHRLALAALRRAAGDLSLFLGGKSLGARMSTHLAAEGEPCAGLVLFGYPLHPAGRPDRAAERTAHFPAIRVPSLFLAGTRDPLAPLESLQARLPTLGGPARVVVIEDADHDFRTPKRTGRNREDVLDALAKEACAWMRKVAGEAGSSARAPSN